MKKYLSRKQEGFTLVEMIVSIGLFTIVLFVATSSFLTIVNADRKARAVRIAADNLNLALEDMQRRIKTGSVYACRGGAVVNDCLTVPSATFAFTAQDGVTRITYTRGTGGACGVTFLLAQGCITRNNGATTMTITSPEIDITSLSFLVKGSLPFPGDTNQPAVVMAINGTFGTALATPSERTNFNIQTVVTQRAYDN